MTEPPRNTRDTLPEGGAATGPGPTGTGAQADIVREMASAMKRGPKAIMGQAVTDFKMLRVTRYGLRPLMVLFLIDFVQGFDSNVPTLFMPEIRADFNITLTQLTLASSLFGMLFAFTGPLIGWMADRYRRTYMLGISAVLSGICSLLSAFAPGFLMFAVLRQLDSASEKLGDVPGQSLAYDYYPVEARAKTVSVKKVAGQILGFLSLPITPLIALRFGWRQAMLVVAIPVIISGLLVLGLPEPVRGYWERLRAGESEESAEKEQPPVKWGEALRILLAIKTLRRILIALPVIMISTSGLGMLWQFWLVEQFRLSPFARSMIGIPGSILGLFMLLAGGGLADIFIKRNPGKILVITAMIGFASTFSKIFVLLFPSLILYLVLSFLINAIDSLLDPAQYAVTSLVIPPRLRGQGVGVLGLIFIPLAPLAVIPAYMADTYGLTTSLMIFSPLALVGGLINLSAVRYFNIDQRAAIAAANATNEYNRALKEGRVKLLVIRDMDVAYDGVQVVFNVDIDIDQGEMVALLGTNGAGKSTVLKAISGIQPADNGAIFLDGRDITRLPPFDISRLGVVHMPGGRAVFPSLTVKENLDLAQLELDETPELAERREKIFEFFPVLRERLDAEAGLLSGGEQQMIGLAQAFLWKPKLLMIDELSLGLAPAVVGQLLDIVKAINAEGTTVVLVEQSVNIALSIAERAIFMEKGEVKFDGETAELLRRPDIMRAVYLKGSAALGAGRRPEATAAPSAPKARPILELEGVHKSFGGKKVLDDVSFTLEEGASLGVIGPNGAGKTTLFDVISGYLPADAGRIMYDGVDITKMSAAQEGKLGLVRRFQDAKLFGSLTVFETVCVALDKKLDVRNPFVTALQLPSVRRSEARIRARADRLIELLELGAFRDKFVSDLSTGSRRIVDLACVLAAEPRVLLLDEPSTGIAQAEAENLGPLLRRIRIETGCSLLVIEHDMQLIQKISDELLAMVLGRVVVRGPADEVLDHPEVVEAYLGGSEEAVKRSGVLI
ncbi:MAG TPA: MFS transporter [Actinomycetota bacterium]|nr:MFS transporter [Actinomycetota bacterium]